MANKLDATKEIWKENLSDKIQLDITDFGKGAAIYLSKLSNGNPVKKIALPIQDDVDGFIKLVMSAAEAYKVFTGGEAVPEEWNKENEPTDILDRERLEMQLVSAADIVELRSNGFATKNGKKK
jgi:hypothetical protein